MLEPQEHSKAEQIALCVSCTVYNGILPGLHRIKVNLIL